MSVTVPDSTCSCPYTAAGSITMATIAVNSPNPTQRHLVVLLALQQRLDMRTTGHFVGWRSGLYNPVPGVSTRCACIRASSSAHEWTVSSAGRVDVIYRAGSRVVWMCNCCHRPSCLTHTCAWMAPPGSAADGGFRHVVTAVFPRMRTL